MEQAVLSWQEGRAGRLRLNRPAALNALNMEMIQQFHEALNGYAANPAVEFVLVDAPERGFCAGGDVRLTREAALAGDKAGVLTFFKAEYALNLAIADFPKPYVSLIDGVCMGGGVGLSIHGSHRVASEAALFAMPETAIGLFPDVGASYFLPRMRGSVGEYLALTGARLAGADGVHAGFATHFVPKAQFAALEAALVRDGITVIPSFAAALPPFILRPRRTVIEAAFSQLSWPQIIDSLESSTSPVASHILGQLRAASPLALHWTLRILQHNAGRSLADCLAAELTLVEKIALHPEFIEGVRAVLVDKDKRPKWQIARLEQVDPAIINEIFADIP